MIRKSAVLTLVVAAAACGDPAGPNADEALLADLAIVAADATLEDVAMWSQPLAFALPAPGQPGGGGGWSGTFSGTRDVTFFDANGVEQSAYDGLTTSRIHIVHEILGEATRDDWSASVHRQRDMEVSGLVGIETQRTWNGTGSEQVSRERVLEDGARSYDAVGSFTYDDVVVPVFGTAPRYPLSGTITRTMTVTVDRPDGSRTRTLEIVITFDGDATANALVNGESVEIDLATQAGRLPFRRLRG